MVEHDTLRVVMEPTRNAWVPIGSWFRRRGAWISMVPTTQCAACAPTTPSSPKRYVIDAFGLDHPRGAHHWSLIGADYCLICFLCLVLIVGCETITPARVQFRMETINGVEPV
ncbi:hypothetical protein B4U45_22095 [Mycobacterium persicum]|uniref:Uncharacterized protein n=1 Tax=Mycobacterium persicum TaxID=1487726 RepID=A0A8E2LPT4_9MYCO|nr:hypothetical protein B1T44_21965 [Mycobacterium persicum]ORC03430.1 hypothetical protein B1T48_21535 [Mycobacterium persicum]ORC08884.1 hypothetical protein B4U45_22095 [Mycobacterium persicum]